MQENELTFEQFREVVAANILSYLPEEYGGASVTINPVVKNNDVKLYGLLIKTEEINVAPNIYLEGHYEQLKNGASMEDVMCKIAQVYLTHTMSEDCNVSNLTDYEAVKDKIECRLINLANNEEYLSDKPYTAFEDLAVIYTVFIDENKDGRMSCPITNAMLSQYNISAEELHKAAMDNLARTEFSLKSMRETMVEMMGPGAEDLIPEDIGGPQMYVLTNKEKIHGAKALLNEDLMESISGRVGGDYYILPSSIHEVLVIPMSDQFNRSDLENMVREVNATQVSPEERLSDNVYAYDSAQKEVKLAEDYEEQLKEREAQQQQSADQEQTSAIRHHRGR